MVSVASCQLSFLQEKADYVVTGNDDMVVLKRRRYQYSDECAQVGSEQLATERHLRCSSSGANISY